MTKIISAKQGNYQALGYNSWSHLDFGTQAAPISGGNPVPFIPLGLNYKFTHLAYTVNNGFYAAGLNLVVNLRSGVVAAPVFNTSYGFFDLTGTFLPREKITLTVGGHVYQYTVNARANTLAKVAAQMTFVLNTAPAPNATTPAFNTLYIANSLGAEVVIQPLSYAAVTTAYSLAVTSAAGHATAGGANMVVAVGSGTLPSQPVSDQTSQGISPSATAVAGNALFPVDIILPTFVAGQAGKTGTVFAHANFDAIWPINSTLTLTTVDNGSIQGVGGIFSLYGAPIDNHRYLPATLPEGFQLNSEIL